MKPLRCCLGIVALLFLAFGRDAFAHHSFAMYDTAKVDVITGTVKEFQWTNPHALLWVVGSTDGGAPELWTIELPTSPGNLARMGWTKHSLAQGDALAVEINPLRDGSHGGSFKKATLAKTGAVLIATAKDDPYGGDASTDAGPSSLPEDPAPSAPSRGNCSVSAGAGSSGASVALWFVLISIAAMVRRRAATS